jgi:hypothetical protein
MPLPQTHLTWRMLAEFTLPTVADGVHLAAAQASATVGNLGLLPAGVEQIAKAVSEAVQNALRPSDRFSASPPLLLQVFAAEPADQDTVHGWGFFVIAHPGNRSAALNGTFQHVIQVFLYQEGGQPRKPAP